MKLSKLKKLDSSVIVTKEVTVKEKGKPKKRSVNLFYKGNAVRILVQKFRRNKHNFVLSYTGYTCLIKNETENIDYFCVKEVNKQPFHLTSKIKADIRKAEIHVDKFNSHTVKYFKVNDLKARKHKIVYNVDIKNAYPTALKKFGFITSELFDLLNNEDKIVKLKAIGQIATRKTIFTFKDGEQFGKVYLKEDEQMRSVWFAICQDVGETIDLTRRSIKSFLFFWFDGIYFTDISEAEKIMQIIKDSGYECRLETLKNFIVNEDDKNLYIKYSKEKDTKHFCLPKSEKAIY